MSNLFDLTGPLKSRSISFENPTGAKGEGGGASSPLGVGRKGDPAREIPAGETVTLAEIAGNGTIRHIWMTTFPNPKALRGLVLRIWWDDQDQPSIETPLGDFMGFAHGATPEFQSFAHSVGKAMSMNFWLPMPFQRGARITLCNETPKPIVIFYQIDYTVDDGHNNDVGRLHVLFRRENPTTKGEDFELLPKRTGRGRYLGTVIGVRPFNEAWWGEGEIKVYLDGDDHFPTICGTGSEDYVGLSWGLQQSDFLYHGASLCERDGSDTGLISMYRWHIHDPVFWQRDIRITMQQIGHEGTPENLDQYKANLFERQDDWSCSTFWYEQVPSAPLPEMPDYVARVSDLAMVAMGTDR